MEDYDELSINQTIDSMIEFALRSLLNHTDDSDKNVHIDFGWISDNHIAINDNNRTDYYEVIFMAPNFILAMNITLFIIGLLGNIIACIVILRGKTILTTTNYYLLNLSVSDVSVLMTRAPFEIYISYYHSEIQYKYMATCFFHYLSFQTAVNVSTLTVTAFTIERYLAICHPFVVKSMLQVSQVKKIIILIWLVAALFAFSPFVLDGCSFDYWNSRYCAIDYEGKYALIFSTIFFFIPTALITMMYILIGIKLKSISNNKQLGVQSNRDTGKTIRMLALIVVGFILCWAPYYAMEVLSPHIIYMVKDLSIIGVNRPENMDSNKISWDDYQYEYNSSYIFLQIIRWLILIKRISSTLAPTLNPIIYTMMSKNFRVSLQELLFNIHRRNDSTKSRSSSSRTNNTTSPTV